jgi:transmembrane sensor
MSPDGRKTFNTQIVEEASEWLVEFRLGDLDTLGRREFDTWIRTSPQHLRAYLEIAAIWNETGSLEAHRDLDSRALIALARAERNVVSLRAVFAQDPPSAPPGPSQNTRRPSRATLLERCASLNRRISQAALALALVAAAGVAITLWSLNRGALYATAVGERRTLRLEDGSAVELDSRSRIRVRFSPGQRNVELLEGQVLVHVAKDPQRPFVVSSEQLRVRAIGTQFDINRKTTGTTVTVVEGRVAVYGSETSEPGASFNPRAAAAGAAGAEDRRPNPSVNFLSAGEQLTVGDRAIRSEPLHTNIATATAWTQGQLVLESATLADVADYFNRYSTRRLTVADSGARPLRLSGVFATDPEFLLRYLRQRPDIALKESANEVHIIRR